MWSCAAGRCGFSGSSERDGARCTAETTPVKILNSLQASETILLPNKEEEEEENKNMTNPSNKMNVHYVIVFRNYADLFLDTHCA